MSKNILEDMVLNNNSNKDLRKKSSFLDNFDNKKSSIEISDEENFVSNNNSKKNYKLWFIAFIAIIILAFALSFLYSSAEIVIYPKIKPISLNGEFIAKKDAKDGELPFELVILQGEESKIIATENKDEYIETKASGKVIIYNNYSSQTQLLSIDTRLIGSNGKIYKTKNKVIVPGKTNDTPGAIEVEIYAEKAGEEYNSGPMDFSIFGFKGSSKYDKFYARSKGPVVDGYKGKRANISLLDQKLYFAELKSILKEKLSEKIKKQIPTDFILYKNASFFNIDEEKISFDKENNNTILRLKGTVGIFIFKEKDLERVIGKKEINSPIEGERFTIPNLKDFTLAVKDVSDLEENTDAFSFNLKGDSKIIWQVDQDKFLKEILGKTKNEFQTILASYTEIDNANLSLKPFWSNKIPEKSNKIKVIINQDY